MSIIAGGRRRGWIIALLLACALAQPGFAQDDGAPPPADPDAAAAIEEADPGAVGEQLIDVNEGFTDDAIAARLRDILGATERFRGLAIEVRDGVVFLRGVARTEESRTLAGDLARRTEGVAVVFNDLTVDQGPLWSLEPARREVRALVRSVVQSLPLFAIGAVVLLIAVLIAGGVARVAGHVIGRATDSVLLRGVLQKTVFVAVILVGVYVFLRIAGLERIALTVISGTGLLGLIVGFAFRDIAENFLASLLLSVQRPFRIGDVIEVQGSKGIVQKMTTRGTLLIDFDGNHIQLANATVYKNTIKNFTANPNMRSEFTIGIGYDADVTTAQDVVRDTLGAHPAVLNEPTPLVLVDQLGAATVNLRVYFWVDGSAHSVVKVKSSTMRLVVAALDQAGVSMPDEAREIIFPDGVPVRMVEEKPVTREWIDAAPTDAPAPAPAPAPAAAPATVTEAEDRFESEVVDLERQAKASRDPDGGANVLADEADASPPSSS